MSFWSSAAMAFSAAHRALAGERAAPDADRRRALAGQGRSPVQNPHRCGGLVPARSIATATCGTALALSPVRPSQRPVRPMAGTLPAIEAHRAGIHYLDAARIKRRAQACCAVRRIRLGADRSGRARLSAGMGGVDTIRGGIAPSPCQASAKCSAPLPGYASQPVELKRDGQGARHPLTSRSLHHRAARAGAAESTLFSLVDAGRAPSGWPEAKPSGWAPGRFEILHRARDRPCWLVRIGLVRSLLPLAS